MTTIYDILRRPIVTEKSNYLNAKLGRVVFEVHPAATKAQVKEAVEAIFDVHVERVNMLNEPAKRSRRARSRRMLIRKPAIKKAIVTLAKGQKIDVLEGVK
ncbi:MAG TPA: 50S ribosomal protein L23 [Anaerolineales bacterium]|nr:50S ribosomal protein L23 [Anaerolineales bacterium]